MRLPGGVCSVTVTIADDDASPDRAALIALYDATDGANWTTKTNWKDESKPISTWHGVTVSQNRVTRLSLVANNLTGTIPSQLGNLSNLTRLNLGLNGLTGTIPSELGNLSSLTRLILAGNALTGQFLTVGQPVQAGGPESRRQRFDGNGSFTVEQPVHVAGTVSLR